VRDPKFAYRTGLRAHLSAYGMYGFAILSSMNYRQTMQFAVNYHLLATPLTIMQFSENDGCGIWHLNPISSTRIDSRLYKFFIEMQFGIILSLHLDVMGPSFRTRISGHLSANERCRGVSSHVRCTDRVRSICQ
jgi:hypothetical protein